MVCQRQSSAAACGALCVLQILVDGKDITEVDAGEYRRQIGVVPQDPHLLSMSIADNIACALLCPGLLPSILVLLVTQCISCP